MEGKIQRTWITDNIEYLVPQDPGTSLCCSGMIIHSSAKILFDTNFGEALTRDLLRSEKPDFAVISHYHLDHSIWGSMVHEHSNATVLIPSGEEDFLTSHDYFIENTFAPYGLGEIWRDYTRTYGKYREIVDFNTYDGSSDIKLRDLSMEFVLTSGHSPGHTSIHFHDHKVIFTGDMGLNRFGLWYGWKDCNLVRCVESLLELKSMKPALLLTSHEGIIRENIEETIDLGIKIIFQREAMIEKKLGDGSSRQEIIDEGIFYKNKKKAGEPMKSFMTIWDSIMLDHHIKKLNEGGLRKDFPGLGFLVTSQ